MTTVDTLLQYTKVLVNLVKSIESGEFATEVLADVEFKAASASLSKVNLAKDYKSQIWNGVGQLETCYQALIHTIESIKWWQMGTIKYDIGVIIGIEKARYILCVMAVYYAYLSEPKLCQNHLSEARYLRIRYNEKLNPKGWYLVRAKYTIKITTLVKGFGLISLFDLLSARLSGKFNYPKITDSQIDVLEHNLLNYKKNLSSTSKTSSWTVFYCQGKKKNKKE